MDESNDNDSTPSGSPPERRMTRRSFTLQEKMCFLRRIRKKIENENEAVSIKAACRSVNIDPKQYRNWRKSFNAMKAAKNNKAKTLCPGRASILKPIEGKLLEFIFAMREQGMHVNNFMVRCRALQEFRGSESGSREFLEKSMDAQLASIRRFIKTNGLVFRMATHESQADPRKTSGEAMDFVQAVRPKLKQPCRHQDFIINMDQTPVPFSYESRRTIEVVGARTVPVRKSTSDTKRATFAMTITASGKVLKPLLVFKGVPGGRIEKREFPTLPKDIVYSVQGNAWMDSRVMLIWVEKILKPYIDEAPEDVVPILFLDSYRCHMMRSVVEAIQLLGVEVEHIPGGCTYLTQPVDIGVNKPFKDRIRRQWEDWMVETGITDETTKPPTRADIAKWTAQAQDTLSDQIVRNAWRHGDYTWFPDVAGRSGD